jgi:hypothetical protein
MIIQDERDLNLSYFFDNVGTQVKPSRNPDIVHAFLEIYRLIESDKSAQQLQQDLIQHHCPTHGN